MLGLGHVLGYFAGTLDLTKYLGNRLGSTQFKQICVIASFAIIFCSTVTCYCVEERVLISRGWDTSEWMKTANVDSKTSANDGHSGILKLLATIQATALNLPRKIRAVCWITFWSWIGQYSRKRIVPSSSLLKPKAC